MLIYGIQARSDKRVCSVDVRNIAFFDTFSEAEEVLMSESPYIAMDNDNGPKKVAYPYAIIEKCRSGFYDVETSNDEDYISWYEYNYNKGVYEKIPTPEEQEFQYGFIFG